MPSFLVSGDAVYCFGIHVSCTNSNFSFFEWLNLRGMGMEYC